MAHVSVLGLDITMQILHVVGMDDSGAVVLRKRCPRGALMSCIAQLPPVVIGMESCGGAHGWARRFREHGHTVKLMAPQCVKPSMIWRMPKRLGRPSPDRRCALCQSRESRGTASPPESANIFLDTRECGDIREGTFPQAEALTSLLLVLMVPL
jgi:hypothetical protein